MSYLARSRSLPLLAAAVLLEGCAAQGPPHPPRLQRPQAVSDLAVRQVGRALELRFAPPSLAVDGESLTKPLEIELFRGIASPSPAGTAAYRAPAGTPVAAKPFLTLSAGDVAHLTTGGEVEYSDVLSPAEFGRSLGARFAFQARGLTRGFRGRPIEADVSNTAALTLLDVPQAPTGLAIEPSQTALRLGWSAPTKTVTGRPVRFIANYRVYRSGSARPFSFQFLGAARQTAYEDSNFEFGHRYAYRVRAVVIDGGQTAESDDSAPASIVPVDTFPPAAPAGLSGVYSFGGVELIWSPNAEPDLAGYNVYRREAGVAAVKLNSELLHSPLYRDPDVNPGHAYTYEVTAVDRDGNESTPSPGAVIRVP